MKKNAAALLMLFAACLCMQAMPQNEEMHSEAMTISDHMKLFEKWKSINKGSYTARLSYNAFSPFRGIWQIHVKNGNAVKWVFRNRENNEKDRQAALMFTQENLFLIAEKAYSEDNNSPYVTLVTYSSKGYIKEIIRKKNPEYKGSIPSDTGFSLRILDINY